MKRLVINIGDVFGNKTVIEPIRQKDGRLEYKCMCICGKHTIHRASRLVRHKTPCFCVDLNMLNQTSCYNVTGEEWKDVLGYEGHYRISSHGRLQSFKMKGRSSFVIITPSFNKRTGYMMFRLHKNNSAESVRANRLVALTFIPNPENKPCVNHINGIKTDNRVVNLEWCTHKENTKHAIESGLLDFSKRTLCRGEATHCSKLKEKDVTDILSIGSSLMLKDIAKRYGVTATTISSILKGRIWKHIPRP